MKTRYATILAIFAITHSLYGKTADETPVLMLGSNAAREGTVLVMSDNGARLNSKENVNLLSSQKVADKTVEKYSVGPLSAGKKYEVEASGVKTSFKTKPDFVDRTPPPDFTFALLGENYDNDPEFDPPFRTPGGNYEIYDAVASRSPDFSIWTAGATTLRPADAASASGIAARYIHARKMPQIRKLLESSPNYGVFSENCSSAKGVNSSSGSKEDAKRMFDVFWSNPAYPIDGLKAYSFSYSDAEFFILDGVSNRSRLNYEKNKPAFLGDRQLEWLMEALAASRAKFKIIVMCSPMANPVESPENFADASTERNELFRFLISKKIGGVVFMSGGKNYGELTRFVRAGGYPLMEVTTPPLTGRPDSEAKEMNYFRVPSSGLFERGFTIVKIDGEEKNRNLRIHLVNSKNEEKFSLVINESELYKFE